MNKKTAQIPIAFVILLGTAFFFTGCSTASPEPQTGATASPTATTTPLSTATSTPMPTATQPKVTLVLPTYPPTRTPTITSTPGPPRAAMELIFADEFDGTELDASKWMPCYPWDDGGCTNSGNNELEWYLPGNVEVHDGMLRLRAEIEPVTSSDGKEYPYTSGMVSSYQRFDITYGYFEMRARMPAGRGLWPAFWTLPSTLEWPPEIDILEVLGHETEVVYTTLHYKQPGNPHLSIGQAYLAGDLSVDFHIYACDWKKDEIVWYVDGNPVFRVRNDIPQQPMYIIANLAVGGNWPGSPSQDTQFPAYFDIDYIRVYRDSGMSLTQVP